MNARQQIAAMLNEQQIEITLDLGETVLRLDQIANLTADQHVTLESVVGEPQLLRANGAAFATAILVRTADGWAAQVVQLLAQPAHSVIDADSFRAKLVRALAA